MKKAAGLLMIGVALMALSIPAPAEEKAWFDMENCAFCKHLLEDPHLLEGMTWEHHDISNGLLTLTMVKPECKEAYLKAMKAMEQVGAEMQQGKTDLPMCGHCEYYGKLMMSGAKVEYVPTSAGDIVLITSDKPEVLSMIGEYGKRTREELVKLKPAVAE